MLLVMQRDATESQVKRVCEAIRAMGYEPHPMPGAQRTAICITGNEGAVATETLAPLPGIREIIRVSKPYKLVTRELKPESTVISVNGHRIGGAELSVIAGPCSVESEETTLRIAETLRSVGVRLFRGGAYKPRTSPYSFQGLGKKGLEILAKAKREFGLSIVTEVMDTETLPLVEEVADILQVGARNMGNTTLLKRLGAEMRITRTLDQGVLGVSGVSRARNVEVVEGE